LDDNTLIAIAILSYTSIAVVVAIQHGDGVILSAGMSGILGFLGYVFGRKRVKQDENTDRECTKE
jgi:hypothetical protein